MSMTVAFPHLALSRWPFNVVPTAASCNYIADRGKLAADIEQLLDALNRRETSSIHIFWAWFGAGKTHTLFYIRNRALEPADSLGRPNGIVPVYTDFPKAPRGFLDIYKTFTAAVSFDRVAEAYLELSTGPDAETFGRRIRSASLDLQSALQVLATGTPAASMIAERWLLGEKLPVAEFRKAGISRPISGSEEAGRIFTEIVQCLSATQKARGARVGRVVWLIDEFQRIADTPSRTLREINSGLHSLFNACPSGLTLIISFSGNPQQELPAWFSAELRDRIGVTKVIVLPPLDRSSAVTFVKDVLHHCRFPGKDVESLYPFTRQSCDAVIAWLDGKTQVKPRTLMQAFGQVLEVADPLIEAGDMQQIGEEFARKVLAERMPVMANDAS